VPLGVEVSDTEATHVANAVISLVVRELLNEGMIAPPSVIWSAIRVADGRRRSRFGPTWALASPWNARAPAVRAFSELEIGAGPEATPTAPANHDACTEEGVGVAITSAAVECTVASGVYEEPAVRAEHLTKRFGDVLAVDDLSFELERGTVTGFLGPNGAGKTTTLRMLLHLVQPTSGQALVFGGRYQDLKRPASRVGAVLEAADFHPGRSGRDHLFALALALGREREDGNWFLCRERAAAGRVDAVLGLVELSAAANRRVGSYSLGMRQRLGLAGALLGDPELLILDEPANGLDPEGVRWLRDFMRSFAAEGKTVLVSSHVLAEVQQTVDQVVIINKGRLVTFEPLARLTAHLCGGVRVRAPGAHRLRKELEQQGIRSSLLDGDELLVEDTPSARIGELAFAAGIPLHELVPEASSLEDVFLELTAEGRP
jgi:ABC-2 type transport system ATP-binding protein